MVTKETDPNLVSLEQVLLEADVLILATPHSEYRLLKTHKRIIDVWALTGSGVMI
jgi:UDP-N-acetyl-D-mannosaminuronic acid dehydrogenase